MHRVYQSSATPVLPQFLLCAPKVAGLLPAHAESLRPSPLNPPSLTLTDYRLETIPPNHYHALIAVSKRLFRATVDYLIDQNEDTDGHMHLTSLDYVSEINELFEPLIDVFTASAQRGAPPMQTIEEMNADLRPLMDEIVDEFRQLGWMPKTGDGE